MALPDAHPWAKAGPLGDARPLLGLPTFCGMYRMQERVQAVYGGHDTHQGAIIDDR